MHANGDIYGNHGLCASAVQIRVTCVEVWQLQIAGCQFES